MICNVDSQTTGESPANISRSLTEQKKKNEDDDGEEEEEE